MENIVYEYWRDKSTEMSVFIGESNESPRHFHRNLEILYVTSGEIDTTVGDEHFIAGEDEIIFVHSYYVHSFMPKTDYKKYVMIVAANYGNDVDKILKASTLESRLSDKEFNRKYIKPIFKKMLEEADIMPPLVKKGYLNVIIGQLFEHYPSLPIKAGSNIEFVLDILHYIEEHYNDELNLDILSDVFGYNKYYFSRIFNRYVGESLTNYINVIRLQNFLRRVEEDSSLQISKLAMDCGFESMPTFYRTFTKIYGESPKNYFAKK